MNDNPASYIGRSLLRREDRRLLTGQGQFVEVPMFETFTHFMLMEHLAGQTFDPPVGSVGYARQLDPHRQPFPTADGHICIVPYSDESWARIFAILGAPEVLEQERFATRGLRGRNVTALYQEIAALTPRRTTEAWLASLHAASIAAMPVRDIWALSFVSRPSSKRDLAIWTTS